jgi:uncharacterized protein (TIGR00369 family)
MDDSRIQQPNSRNCFVCGVENPAGLHLRFYDNGVDEVTCDFTVYPKHQSYPGIVHGGVIASILDEAGGRTAAIDDHNRFFVTAKLQVRYRKPVPLATPLRAVGKRLKRQGSKVVAHAEIRSPAGEVLAEAELLLLDAPPNAFNPSEADELGWRVYADPGPEGG